MNITYKILRVITVPLLVAPAVLWMLTAREFSGAIYTFWPLMLAVLIINIPMVFVTTKKANTTLMLGWVGAQIGCLLHIFAQYGIVSPNYFIEWPSLYDGAPIIAPDWLIFSLILGIVIGGAIDLYKLRSVAGHK